MISFETWALLTDHAADVVEMVGDLFDGPLSFGDWEAEADEIESTRPATAPHREAS